MTLQEPLWLIAAVLVSVAGGFGLRLAEAKRRRDLERFVASPLLASLAASSSRQRRLGRGALLIGAVALGCVALAQPMLGFRWEETRRRGTDVLFAVDVSRSMLAGDVKPDRLTRAKLGVIDLLEHLGGDRVGLVAFAGSAFLQSPLTSDHRAFREALEALDTSLIPRGGTDVGAALHEAEAAFRTAPSAAKIVVLVTDGEDLEGNARVAAAEAAKNGITVYAVGVGTPEGETISLARAGGRGVVTDESGQPVTSRLDEAGLREVAEATGGFYIPLGARGEGLATIHEQVLSKAPQQEHSARSQRVPLDRYQWPLGLALAAAVGEALLSDRRRQALGRRATRAVALAAAPALALLLAALPALASPKEAEQAFAAGEYEAAHGHWQAAAEAQPDDPRLRFNEGVAAYKAGKPEEAAAAFGRAIETGEVSLQQRAYYDLGNARFRLAELAAKSSPGEAKKALEEAIGAYDGALALDGKDEDASFNRDVAKQRLEALEQQEQQQEQQNAQQSQQEEQQSQQKDPQQEQQGAGAEPPEPDAQAGEPGESQQDPPPPGQQAEPKAGDDNADQPGEAKAGQKPSSPEEQASKPKAEGAAESPGKEKPPEADTEKSQSETKPERADGKQGDAVPQAGGAGGREGEMSAADAEQLLDSLRGEDVDAPRTASGRGAAGGVDDEPIRNW